MLKRCRGSGGEVGEVLWKDLDDAAVAEMLQAVADLFNWKDRGHFLSDCELRTVVFEAYWCEVQARR